MFIVMQQAEYKLSTYLGMISEDGDGKRCLHMQLSGVKKLDNQDLGANDVLKTVFSDPDAHIYCCCDGDVIVVAKGITNALLVELDKQLAPCYGGVTIRGLMPVYDLRRERTVVEQLCKGKVEILEKKARQQALIKLKKKQEEQRKMALSIMLTPQQKEALKRVKDGREKQEILVVEDDEFSRNLTVSALRPSYDVLQVGTGFEAVKSYVSNGPNIVFLDIGLPDMSGHEVLQKMLSLDPSAYVVMLSGQGDKINVLKAIKLGAKGFVSKPFNKESLLQYINQNTLSSHI